MGLHIFGISAGLSLIFEVDGGIVKSSRGTKKVCCCWSGGGGGYGGG